MKKITALLLAVLMIFTLFGCSGGGSDDATDAPDSGNAETENPDSGNTEEPYEIVYLCPSYTIEWCLGMVTQIEKFSEAYNFELVSAEAEFDAEKYVTTLETLCGEGIDGFILMTMPELQPRVYEICTEAGIPFIYDAIAFTDAEGKLTIPGAEMNAIDFGAQCGQWFVDNYQSFWGDDVDPATLGYIDITYTTMQSMIDRSAGALAVFQEAFPDCENLFKADLVTEGATSTEAAAGLIAPILAAHPEIEHWVIIGVQDIYAQGSARACEEAGFDTSKALVISVGGENLIPEWEAGYEGVWVAADYCSPIMFTIEEVPALMALVTGEKEAADLWPDWKTGDNEFASLKLSGIMVTRDTYKDAMADEEAALQAALDAAGN